MTGSKLSQRAARRRRELHHADGDRLIGLTIEAQRHLNTPGSGRASIQHREGHGGMTETTPQPSEILESERPALPSTPSRRWPPQLVITRTRSASGPFGWSHHDR
jgi:hypothetical protein